ncbi:unnamed protein product [Urochloa decumbens]|uniref:F-box domain-containing protein n=1 Tax=Urochloa decumbens TaxID=240449 RepID=A0ABC8WBP6_9POAL
MESRSGHGRQGGPSPPRRSPNPKPQSYINDGVDRISGLPDHLLEEILRRIRCARSAARTSLLSRRWRHGLWRDLPELSFRGIAAEALPVALTQVARPDLSLLDIHTISCFEVAGITSLLRAAARLAPAELVVSADLLESWGGEHFIPFKLQLPCFHRANSITLELRHHIPQLQVTGGEFPVLERLSLVNCPVHSISDLISRAPRLRSLQLCHRLYYTTCPGKIMVHSTTLEELLLDRWELFGGIDIVAPALRTFTLTSSRLLGIHVVAPELKMFTLSARIVSNHPRITLSAAATVEYLSWTCSFPMTPLIHGVWCLRELKLGEKKDAYVLSLTLDGERTAEQPRNLQEVVQFPRVSVLELYLHTFWPEAHVYGPMVLDLMGIFADIKRLKLVIRDLICAHDETSGRETVFSHRAKL